MKTVLKFSVLVLFAPLFWPMGIMAMSLTAVSEFLQPEPDWTFWRQQHKPIFNMMGIGRLFR